MRPLTLLVLMLALLPAAGRAQNAPDLLLEVRIGRHLLSDGVAAYQQGGDVLLPLGEMARLLTIAVRSDPQAGRASGYILDERRAFSLDLAQALVVREDRRETLDASLVRAGPDDIYVASSLLAAWLPAGFGIDMASLVLQVAPRERLPVQARLEREDKRLPGAAGPAAIDPGYPRLPTPYRLARMPFADQTVDIDLRRGGRQRATASSYTAYLTADLLGTEAALYLNTGKQSSGPAARLTMGRHDPDAQLLGPLKARSVQVGSVAVPGVQHIALGSATGTGVHFSNRPLGQPMRFDRHTLQGDLPPGWDVELFFNDALVGFQQSRADGRYSFDDQPLIYGANDFRLVFHGPLGQIRVERHSFLLEQSMLAPGQLHYSLTAQRDDDARLRGVAQFEWGLGRRLTASASLARVPAGGEDRSYASLGLHGYWNNVIGDVAAVRADDGGALWQAGLRTRAGPLALSLRRSLARGFVSDFYQPAGDTVRLRDELRVDGTLAGFPLSLLARRDRFESGQHKLELNARVSAYRHGTAFSNTLRWHEHGIARHADGLLQASRRMAGIGISGQLQYTIRPETALATLALSADKHLDDGYLVGIGVTRTFADPRYRFSAALNKSLGRFGMGVSAFYARRGEYGVGLQLFMALGQEPRSAQWMMDAAPMAANGNASLRVFLDKDRNGVMDGADEPIAGAGFLVNGGQQMVRTDHRGIAWMGRLAANQHSDIAIDPATLEDPQWVAREKGMRIVARAGTVSELDFAVGITGEIDGTTYIVSNGIKRGAADFQLELVDAAQAVVATAASTSDGCYVLAGVAPGDYLLRIAPSQLARLGLREPAPHRVRIGADGDFVNGKDFVVVPAVGN